MEQFFNAINVWLVKPQVSSSKIFAAKVIIGDHNNLSYSRKLIFKDNTIPSIIEKIVKNDSSVVFSSEFGSYEIKLDNREICVLHNDFQKHPVLSTDFFQNTLKARLNVWMYQEVSNKASSLSLIDVEYYQSLYIKLKSKYGPELVKNWEEKTDPEKFVYEDIAIASYLMSLWKDQSKDNIKFIDLGCGNGLLVYLLIMEGYTGIGVDLRSRNIWATYPQAVQQCLSVSAVEPSSRYEGYTWWIGNHSDELTPWIPVIAAKSSLSRANVFLLPCCSFDFFGKFGNDSKVKSDQSNESRYQMYQNFVKIAMQKSGFNVKTDYLRIPSTKRFSLIGTPKISNDIEFKKTIFPMLEEFIQSRPRSNCQFRPRDAEIANKNCSSIERSVQDLICDKIFSKLLSIPTIVTSPLGTPWNKGGRLPIGELVNLFPGDVLHQLKTEHGGLQTLLKNHHQAFKVVGGFVEIRYEPNEVNRSGRKRKRGDTILKLKTKSCWHQKKHPDGCPFSEDNCNFVHKSC